MWTRAAGGVHGAGVGSREILLRPSRSQAHQAALPIQPPPPLPSDSIARGWRCTPSERSKSRVDLMLQENRDAQIVLFCGARVLLLPIGWSGVCLKWPFQLPPSGHACSSSWTLFKPSKSHFWQARSRTRSVQINKGNCQVAHKYGATDGCFLPFPPEAVGGTGSVNFHSSLQT